MENYYRLTSTGDMLAHNIRPESGNNRWRIIYYLSKNGCKSRSDILEHTGASLYDLSFLAGKNIIVNAQGLTV